MISEKTKNKYREIFEKLIPGQECDISCCYKEIEDYFTISIGYENKEPCYCVDFENVDGLLKLMEFGFMREGYDKNPCGIYSTETLERLDFKLSTSTINVTSSNVDYKHYSVIKILDLGDKTFTFGK